MNTTIWAVTLLAAVGLASRAEQSAALETAKNLAAGSVGGAALVYSGQPLDRAKVLLQTSPGRYKGPTDCLRSIYRQNGIRGLYTGATASLYAEVGANVIMYASYQAAKQRLLEHGLGEQAAAIIAGGFSGALVSSVYGPLDLLKIRMQTQRAPERAYSGTIDCARQIVQKEGAAALLNGLCATLLRTVPQVMVYFYSYDMARKRLGLDPLIAGGLAGLACWCVGLPLDTVKSRIQAAPSGTTLLGCTKAIIEKDGLAGFYRGWQPVMLRAAIVNACCFKAIEVSKAALDDLTPE